MYLDNAVSAKAKINLNTGIIAHSASCRLLSYVSRCLCARVVYRLHPVASPWGPCLVRSRQWPLKLDTQRLNDFVSGLLPLQKHIIAGHSSPVFHTPSACRANIPRSLLETFRHSNTFEPTFQSSLREAFHARQCCPHRYYVFSTEHRIHTHRLCRHSYSPHVGAVLAQMRARPATLLARPSPFLLPNRR